MKEIIGLIPAGGSAKRLGNLPCSKEIFPVGFTGTGDQRRPRVVSQDLIEKYRAAGCRRTYVILRQGKWDIPAYYGDGQHLGMELAYLMLRHLYGVPYTLDQAYPFVREARVLLGFPDMLFEPLNVFGTLLEQQEKQEADLVLGLYTVADAYAASKSDMVDWNPATGELYDIQVKPVETPLRLSWINAVWGPAFTDFLHRFIATDLPLRQQDPQLPEIQLGNLFVAAARAGLRVRGHFFEGNHFLDIGTLPSLEKSWQSFSLNNEPGH